MQKMNLKQILELQGINAWTSLFLAAWDKNPRTMRQTLKYLVLKDYNVIISTQTAEALLQKMKGI